MRARAKTIDQVEASEKSIFSDEKKDARKEPKEFEIARAPNGLYYVKYNAGGEVPDSLKGKFTSIPRAQVAIDNVLAERKQKQSKAG